MTNWLWPTRGLLPLIIFLHQRQHSSVVVLLLASALMRQAVAGATTSPMTSHDVDDRPLSNVSTQLLLSYSRLSITAAAAAEAVGDYLTTSTTTEAATNRLMTTRHDDGKYTHYDDHTKKGNDARLLSSETTGIQRLSLVTISTSPHPSRSRNKSHHHQHQQQQQHKHHGTARTRNAALLATNSPHQQQPVTAMYTETIVHHGGYHGDEGEGRKDELVEFSGVAWLSLQGVHVCLATASLFVNTLALVAAHGYAVRLSPSLQLLTSLGLAHGLGLCGIAALYFRPSTCQRQLHAGLVMVAHNAMALTLAVWAVLQTCATLTPHRCAQLARTRPIWAAVSIAWVLSLLAGHAHFLLALCPSLNEADKNDVTGSASQTYCEQAQNKSILPVLVSLVTYTLVIIVGTSAYVAAACRLRRPLMTVEGEGRCYRQPSATNSREPLTLSASVEEHDSIESANDHNNHHSITGLPKQQHHQAPATVNTYMSSTDVVTGVILLVFYALAWGPYLAAKFYQVLSYSFSSRGREGRSGGGTEEEGYWVMLQGTLLAPLCFCLVCPLLCGVRVVGMDIAYLRLYHAWRARFVSLGHVLRPSSSSSFAAMPGHSSTPIERDLTTTPLQAIESIC